MFFRLVKLLSFLLLHMVLFSREVHLDNIEYYPQTWNNCASASLSMILSYYDLDISQQFIESRIKSNKHDVHISPEELQSFMLSLNYSLDIYENTSLDSIIEILDRHIPIMVPIWHIRSTEDQMGHYVAIVGYDISRKILHIKDPLDGDRSTITYKEFDNLWRVFNRIVLLPGIKKSEGLSIKYNKNVEIEAKDFFDWYNLGVINRNTPEVALDYFMEALKFDFPERFFWYNTRIFETLYSTQQYEVIIDLTNKTLRTCLSIEEIWYWRARAQYALNMHEESLISINNALKYRSTFKEAIDFKTMYLD